MTGTIEASPERHSQIAQIKDGRPQQAEQGVSLSATMSTSKPGNSRNHHLLLETVDELQKEIERLTAEKAQLLLHNLQLEARLQFTQETGPVEASSNRSPHESELAELRESTITQNESSSRQTCRPETPVKERQTQEAANTRSVGNRGIAQARERLLCTEASLGESAAHSVNRKETSETATDLRAIEVLKNQVKVSRIIYRQMKKESTQQRKKIEELESIVREQRLLLDKRTESKRELYTP